MPDLATKATLKPAAPKSTNAAIPRSGLASYVPAPKPKHPVVMLEPRAIKATSVPRASYAAPPMKRKGKVIIIKQRVEILDNTYDRTLFVRQESRFQMHLKKLDRLYKKALRAPQ